MEENFQSHHTHGIVKKMINHLVVFSAELIFTHIVISMPMDFQAMLKRVEAGGYKSKT